MKKAIGGYFELELNDYGTIFHDNAIALNSARHAFEYILRIDNTHQRRARSDHFAGFSNNNSHNPVYRAFDGCLGKLVLD